MISEADMIYRHVFKRRPNKKSRSYVQQSWSRGRTDRGRIAEQINATIVFHAMLALY